MTPKAILSFQPSMSGHKFSTCATRTKFNVIVPGLCEPHISDDVLSQLVSGASNPAQKSSQCNPSVVWGVEAFLIFLAFLFGGICNLPFTLSRRQSQHVLRCCEIRHSATVHQALRLAIFIPPGVCQRISPSSPMICWPASPMS